MVWYGHMVLGRGLASKEKMIRYRISHRKAHVGVWLVILPRFEHQVLEIIPSTLLLQENYPLDDLTVIGMALTRKEAVDIAAELAAAAVIKRGDADVAAYLGSTHEREMSRE
ncbi:MAG: hypothetical protein LUC41_07255 [Clostridiales bacterium]|nr:hypothetical protein [Clostridiales bacterium]